MNSKNEKTDKLTIFFESLDLEFFETKNDPKSLLITRFSEILKFLNTIKDGSKYKNLFLKVTNIHDILYKENENIEVNNEDAQQSLSEYFYLDKLINKNTDALNFTYNLKFIEKINEENKKYGKSLRQLIISKIILDFINYYKQLDDENENVKVFEKKIKNIEKGNREIIMNNINYLVNTIGLNIEIEDLIKMEVDDLYVEIIYTLIINKKIQNCSFFLGICEQMDLDSIDISKKLYEKYLELLFKDNNYSNYYLVTDLKQLFCPITINYFYFLFKYILKDSSYIYQIPFLFKVRNNILKILKTNSNFITIKKPKKTEFVIKKFLDIDYYINKYIEKDFNRTNINYTDNDNDNENDFIKLYSKAITINQALTTYFASNKETFTHENKEENKSKKNKINEIRALSEINNNQHLFSNCSLEISKKIKSNNDSYYNKLNYLEEIINDNIFLEDYNYEQSIRYNLPNKSPQKMLFSDKTKLGFKINENIKVYSYNSYFEGEEDILIIDDKLSNNKTKIKGYSFPTGINGFALIHNKILIGPCKKNGKNGIFWINFEKKDFVLKFEDILINFKATSFCPLLKKGIKETDYFLVAGINIEKKVKIKLVKIIYNEIDNIEMEIINDNIYTKQDENILEFQKPIYYIKQSSENSHIFIYSDKKIYHFSPLNMDIYLGSDEDEKLNRNYEELEQNYENNSFYEEIENNYENFY